MEQSNPNPKLIKLVDAEYITNEKVRNLDLPLEIINVTSKLESQSLSTATYDPNPKLMFTETTDPNNRSKHQSWKYYRYYRNSNHSVQKCFRRQRKDEDEKRNFFSIENTFERIQSIL